MNLTTRQVVELNCSAFPIAVRFRSWTLKRIKATLAPFWESLRQSQYIHSHLHLQNAVDAIRLWPRCCHQQCSSPPDLSMQPSDKCLTLDAFIRKAYMTFYTFAIWNSSKRSLCSPRTNAARWEKHVPHGSVDLRKAHRIQTALHVSRSHRTVWRLLWSLHVLLTPYCLVASKLRWDNNKNISLLQLRIYINIYRIYRNEYIDIN